MAEVGLKYMVQLCAARGQGLVMNSSVGLTPYLLDEEGQDAEHVLGVFLLFGLDGLLSHDFKQLHQFPQLPNYCTLVVVWTNTS